MARQRQLAHDTLALVLAGGNGTRLGQLTERQCKPAIPFAGHFRNIDFTLSNCINSQVRRIGVLTQYKAQTLIGHIADGWNFLPRHLGEFVDVWPAQQRPHSARYAGTADAVYQNLDLILAYGAKYVLVVAGDHVYKMDYGRMLKQHVVSGADATIACVSVPVEQASSFGILGVDQNRAVRSFAEKPDPSTLDAPHGTVLASMGIYVFDTSFLAARLQQDAHTLESTHDFGRDILPAAVRENHVGAFPFTDSSGNPAYWRDVGTLHAYWQAHMELLAEQPAIDLCDPEWPIRPKPRQRVPAKPLNPHRSSVTNSMLSADTVVCGAAITNSVLGPNVQVGMNTVLDHSVVLPGAQIGANCVLRRVIIDSDTNIPDGTIVDGRGFDGAQREITLLTQKSIALRQRDLHACTRTDFPARLTAMRGAAASEPLATSP